MYGYNAKNKQRGIDMNIALIAHDAKKKLMQNFCIAYRGILSKNELYATGTTGRLIEEVTNLTVHKHLAGHLGGEQQLGAQIEHNQMNRMSTMLCVCVTYIIFRLQRIWHPQNC